MKKIAKIILTIFSSLLGITFLSLACFDPIFLVFTRPYASKLLAIWGFLLLMLPQILISRKKENDNGVTNATTIGLSIIIAAVLLSL